MQSVMLNLMVSVAMVTIGAFFLGVLMNHRRLTIHVNPKGSAAMVELIQLTDIGTRKDVYVHPDEIRTVEPLDSWHHQGARARVRMADGSVRDISQDAEIVLSRRRAALSEPETKGDNTEC